MLEKGIIDADTDKAVCVLGISHAEVQQREVLQGVEEKRANEETQHMKEM
jgi:hypothetical protein